MGVKAEWQVSRLLLGDQAANPFEAVTLSSGLHVDLVTATAEELNAAMSRSLQLESRLFDRSVTCELKDGGQDCLECPVYVGDRPEEPGAPLCRLGRDQRKIETRTTDLAAERRQANAVMPVPEFDYEGQLFAAAGL